MIGVEKNYAFRCNVISRPLCAQAVAMPNLREYYPSHIKRLHIKNFLAKGVCMSNPDSRYEDLERTDVLPQLALKSEREDSTDHTSRLARPRLAEHTPAPFGVVAHTNSANGKISTLPAKPSTTDLAVGGIRGKIADLEQRLVEAQERQVTLKHHCDQLTQRCRVTEDRAANAEANYVQQTSELHRLTQQTADAQQRLHEERVRFQAQIVETERLLLEARTRGDKRAASLEQLLNEQTGRAVLSERGAADARVDIEKARGELDVAQAAIRSLEERLAEQTRAASDVTELYSQQTAQVAANAKLVTEFEQQLAAVQTAKAECDDRIVKLEAQVRSANDAVAGLQSEVAIKLRHIGALEQGLASRDQSIDELKAHRVAEDQSTAELRAAKAELDQRCAQLEQAITNAQAVAVNAEQEIARLNAALRGNDVRINELSAALRVAERGLQERDTAIAETAERADAARCEHVQTVERMESLRGRLDEKEQQIDELQAQLQSKSAELTAALAAAQTSQTRQATVTDEMRKLEADVIDMRKTMEGVMAERNQLEIENQAGRAELSQLHGRYEDAVQTILAVRESIAARDQKNASLERELRAATQRIEEANTRIERAAAMSESINAELRQRDNRIASLERKCAEHADALNAIGQDIERVSSANPSERLAAMGYTLESLDHPGTVHRIGRTTTTVGRVHTNDIAIDSGSVSRYHARIVIQPEGVWLIDLQSTNGCGVNGRRISRQILCDGDAVIIGHCRFRFSMQGASKETPATDDAIPLLDEPLLIHAAGRNEVPREQRH
jgi:chromosome segregation ATPase